MLSSSPCNRIEHPEKILLCLRANPKIQSREGLYIKKNLRQREGIYETKKSLRQREGLCQRIVSLLCPSCAPLVPLLCPSCAPLFQRPGWVFRSTVPSFVVHQQMRFAHICRSECDLPILNSVSSSYFLFTVLVSIFCLHIRTASSAHGDTARDKFSCTPRATRARRQAGDC